ncbi:dnaJ homolog subfamily C member 17-like [Daphnia carinata]|uniref:dnaJ homolog subfamily C member 17-like n=1 Tax=Daphnia carinata TaxID=120202 RepID=UPI00257F5E9F|nr:dnaJ homolog subfamily C member 17-like [Daphnia carinata]
MSKIDVTKLDLYGLFEVSPDATSQEIKTAYRKKALKVHPDKNPDNPEAAKLFHQLSEALKVLTDEFAKAAYDRVLRAKKETELRYKQLDSKRKKLKDELEAREKAYQTSGKTFPERSPKEQLKAEIERLRKQGSNQLAEEQEKIRVELAKEKEQLSSIGPVSARLKLSWKVDPDGIDPYSQDKLHSILQKYGNILALLISSKKKGSAIVEFASKKDADLAYAVERGIHACPLTLSWIKGDQPTLSQPVRQPPPSSVAPMSMADFESKVLQSMREAQERKRQQENSAQPFPT